MDSIYKYETHLHTSNGSACASASGAEMVEFYKKKGYSGFVVTDHFINGNTAVDRSLTWNRQIDSFCQGYEEAKKCGDEIDFDVFFGLEFNFRGTEFLIYGLTKQWLKDNQIITQIDLEKALKIIKNAGAMIIHAHPFREAGYIDCLRLIPNLTDAVEIKNGGNRLRDSSFDTKAEIYANMYDKPTITGSDIHGTGPLNEITGGVSTKERLNSIYELMELIKNRSCSMLWNV